MKKIFFFILFIFFNFNTSNSNERSEKEIKIGVFLEDLEQIGQFKEINFSPHGMFPDTAKSFHNKQLRSTQKFISIFVKQKGLMENIRIE